MVQGQYRNVSTATFSAITLYPIIRKKKDIGKKKVNNSKLWVALKQIFNNHNHIFSILNNRCSRS